MNLLPFMLSILILTGPASAVSSQSICGGISATHATVNDRELFKSALNGSAQSQFEIGVKYEYGRGVNQSDSIARCWYEQSASQQYPDAQYRLAVMFDNGWGVEEDKLKAFDNYSAAALGGHVMAQLDLGLMHFYGTGTTRNLVKAYRWLRVANQSGNPLMLKHLQMVAAEMSPAEISLAEQ